MKWLPTTLILFSVGLIYVIAGTVRENLWMIINIQIGLLQSPQDTSIPLLIQSPPNIMAYAKCWSSTSKAPTNPSWVWRVFDQSRISPWIRQGPSYPIALESVCWRFLSTAGQKITRWDHWRNDSRCLGRGRVSVPVRWFNQLLALLRNWV